MFTFSYHFKTADNIKKKQVSHTCQVGLFLAGNCGLTSMKKYTLFVHNPACFTGGHMCNPLSPETYLIESPYYL